MPLPENGASLKKRRLFIPMLDDGASATPSNNTSTHQEHTSQAEANASEKTLDKEEHNGSAKQAPKLEELSIGKLEKHRKQKVNLWRMAASAETGTLFAILNCGYFAVHQQSSSVQDDTDPPLTATMEWLVLNFQEKIAWNIFRHQAIANRPKVRKRIRDLLIQRYTLDTQKVADGYYRHSIPEYTLVEPWDLRQAAVLGMIECIDEYDPSVGCTFMQHANAKYASRIQGAVKDCIRKHWYSTRTVAKHRRIVNPMMIRLTHILGHRPSSDDFCDHYGEEWRHVLEDALFDVRVYNQAVWAPSGETGEVVDHMTQVECDEPPAVSHWNDEDKAYFKKRIMELLPDEKEAFFIYAYYWLGWNTEHIAKDPLMNCSTSRAMEIRDKAQLRIFGNGGYALYNELKELLDD